jgi:TrmH family RNA methyltransferase
MSESTNPLDRVIIVLDHPQNLINIAGVVRGLMNMGLQHLRLVEPAEFDAYRIAGIAHRSEEMIERAEHFASLEDAVGDCALVVGTTARPRTAQRNYGYPREWAPRILEGTVVGKVAIVFGREDKGLSNEALDLCDGAIVIPTDPEYWSLNLAQACLLVSYELFLASQGDELALPKGKRSEGPASREDLEEMFRAIRLALDAVDFFKSRPPETVMRTFRTLVSRASLDWHEARLVKAAGFEVVNVLARQGSSQNKEEG